MLLDGVVYQPYYLGTFLIAGIVTWGCPQTWDWTRTLTAAEGVRDCRALRARGRCLDDAGLQPVHLLHLLMSDTQVLPSGGPSREEIAKIEIGDTTVSPAVARGITAFFLICIVAVPAVEIVVPWATGNRAPTVWSKLTDIPDHISAAVSSGSSLWTRALSANRAAMSGLSGFENALEDESILGQTLRPPAQQVLSGWLGAGNERVYLGRDRWLFYRPDLEYLTNRGFLEPDVIRRGGGPHPPNGLSLPQPDPRPAILAFHRQLAARGSSSSSCPRRSSLACIPNDSSPALRASRVSCRIRRIPISPRGSAAGDLAVRPRRRPGQRSAIVASIPRDRHSLASRSHGARGRAPGGVRESTRGFATGTVTRPADRRTGGHQRRRHRGHARLACRPDALPSPNEWSSAARSPKMAVRGGPTRRPTCFCSATASPNIYSLASMGWGDSAGLAEQLSYALSRPLDRIVQNDDGAFATRALLQRAGPERLAGKRVVIWQFAARELVSGIGGD